MPRHSETRHLPYSPEQLYDMVADVERYDEFLPWVVAVRLRSSTPQETVADLVVGFNAFKERFTSRVTKERPDRIVARGQQRASDVSRWRSASILALIPTAGRLSYLQRLIHSEPCPPRRPLPLRPRPLVPPASAVAAYNLVRTPKLIAAAT